MLRTILYDAHRAAGARMGAFAGYDMPLYYADGVIAEHDWTRTRAGLFDVSHMGQLYISGPAAAAFFEYVTPSNFAALGAGRARYTVLTNPAGGIADDLIITRVAADKFFVVVNAGGKEMDIAHLRAALFEDVVLEVLDDRALLALQGPAAEDILRAVCAIDAADLPYMSLRPAALPDGTDILVSRLGYTGEDGFEISLPTAAASALWRMLLADDRVRPVGLAARDSLRLDMGYCLYGHDIDARTTPVEAGLGWVVGRGNRTFIGHETVLAQAQQSPLRRRVGLKLHGPGIAREGAAILDLAGQPLGAVTSGGFSPTLKAAIAQGYVEARGALTGTKVQIEVRGRMIPAEIAAMPFVPARTKPASAASGPA